MTLQGKLSAMKKESIAKRPPEVVAILLQEVENLVQAGIADNAIKAGEALPEFTLPDDKNNLISSKDLVTNGPLAICFYRGIW